MLPLPLLLPLLLPHPLLLFPLGLLQRVRHGAELLQVRLLVGGERVRGSDGAGLGEAIDDCVGAGRDEGFEDLGLDVGGLKEIDKGKKGERGLRYLLLIIKAHLASRHTGILVQVGPGRVDDRHIVLFVACRYHSFFSSPFPRGSTLSWLSASRENQQQGG